MKEETGVILDNPHSLDRPAWTFDDLHAYRHKQGKDGKSKIENYYAKRKGLR